MAFSAAGNTIIPLSQKTPIIKLKALGLVVWSGQCEKYKRKDENIQEGITVYLCSFAK